MQMLPFFLTRIAKGREAAADARARCGVGRGGRGRGVIGEGGGGIDRVSWVSGVGGVERRGDNIRIAGRADTADRGGGTRIQCSELICT